MIAWVLQTVHETRDLIICHYYLREVNINMCWIVYVSSAFVELWLKTISLI